MTWGNSPGKERKTVISMNITNFVNANPHMFMVLKNVMKPKNLMGGCFDCYRIFDAQISLCLSFRKMFYDACVLTDFTQQSIQGADQKTHQSSASTAFVRGIHWWPMNSLHTHKGPVTRKMFPFDDVIIYDICHLTIWIFLDLCPPIFHVYEWITCVLSFYLNVFIFLCMLEYFASK